MKTGGLHIFIDGKGVAEHLLNDCAFIKSVLIGAANAGNATIIAEHVHPFSPHGVTGFVLLAESHIAIHTWPEDRFFAADLFFCGEDSKIRAAAEKIIQLLEPAETQVRETVRG